MAKIYTDKEKVPKEEPKQCALWHERISIAKKEQERWADESGAKRFEKEYEGDYQIVFHTRNRKIPIPPINEVFAYVQADIATTYNRDPYITVNAKAGSTRGAALWEVLVNYFWRATETKEEIEREIIDKDLVGYAFHKVGTQLTAAGEDELYSSWLSWRDVIWNIGAKRAPMDCRWMAQRIVKPLAEIKALYPAAKTLEGTPNPDVDADTFKKSPYKDDIKVGVMWEIWDKEKKQVLLIGETLKDRYLEAPKPWPEYLKDFPFRMYWDFAGKTRPMSAIAPWEPQILEEMVLMGNAMNHAKRWNRQLFIKGGTIDENAMDKFERGDDGAIVTVNSNLDDASFKFADFGQLPTDFYMLMDRLQAIKRNINGQPEFTRGGTTKTGTRTIGELNLMQKGATGRQDRKIDRLETHCENIARDMVAHLKANFDFNSAIKITGDTPEEIIEALGENYDPATGMVHFTPDDIKGEYDFEVKSGSTLPMDKEHRMQIYELVLTNVAQVASSGSVSPFVNALVQEMLRDYDIKSLKEAYKEEQLNAEHAAAKQAQQGSVEEAKTKAEAMKRAAQAANVQAETELVRQDAMIGPLGRAKLERFVKAPAPSNGSNK